MKILKPLMCAVVAWAACSAPAIRADEWDKKTTITINQPIEIAGTVLSPGTYVLMLDRGSQSERHIVRVKDADAKKLITTIIAYPNYRLSVKSADLQFWEVPKGNPAALRGWFYPGDHWGQQFAYHPVQATQLAKATEEEMPTAPVPAPQEEAAVAEPAPAAPQEAAVESEPADVPELAAIEPGPAAAQPEAAVEPAPTTLPKTASHLPLLALGGLISLGVALLLRIFQFRRRLT